MLIKSDELLKFLHLCREGKIEQIDQVIVPAKPIFVQSAHTEFAPLQERMEFDLDSYRTTDPLKVLLYLVRENVLPESFDTKKRLIVGAKACDLAALAVLDRAMINEEFVDPAYKHWRDNTTIVSSDCTVIAPTCHCTLVDGTPYAQTGYDLNLAQVDGGYKIDVGSPRGETLFAAMKEAVTLEEEAKDISGLIDKRRQATIDRLREQNRDVERPGVFTGLETADDKNWAEESLECIGCGACTNICPTCYCLILNDETEAEQFVKVRSYDSCQWNGYARVAGGGTPRPKMTQRFRNRYLCKFLYIMSNFGMLGCTGCGRCTETCAAQIDFRQVVHRLIESSQEITNE